MNILAKNMTQSRVTRRGGGALAALSMLLCLVFGANQAQAVTQTWCFNGAPTTDTACTNTGAITTNLGLTENFIGSEGDTIIAGSSAITGGLTPSSINLTQINNGLLTGLGVDSLYTGPLADLSDGLDNRVISGSVFFEEIIELDLGANWTTFSNWKIKMSLNGQGANFRLLDLAQNDILLSSTYGSLVSFEPTGQFIGLVFTGITIGFNVAGSAALWEIQADKPDPVSTPEPSALLFVGLGLLGLVGLRHRQKQ